MEKTQSIPDCNQNFWQLASIQGASQGLLGILVGGILTRKYGAYTAILSICIGNLILWIMGLGVISMAVKERKNAIQNIADFLGKGGRFFMAVVLLVAFTTWYMIQIQSVATAMTPIFQSNPGFNIEIFSISLGIFIALFSMGGIRLIKWTCVICFPFLFLYCMYTVFFYNNSISFIAKWDLSFAAIITVIAGPLPTMVNLPTFFRHARTRADAFLALTLMTIFEITFEISSVFSGFTETNDFFNKLTSSSKFTENFVFTVMFVLISLICVNLVNIYFATAAFQTMLSRVTGARSFLLVGFIGTAAYAFLHKSSFMFFLENLTNNFIGNVGAVLLVSFLVTLIVRHRPRVFEKLVGGSCLFIGCLITLTTQIYNPLDPNLALLAGFSGTILALLGILFFEETIWAIKKVRTESMKQ